VGLRTTLADLWLGGTGDGACLHAPPSPAEFAPTSSAGSLVLLVLFLALCCVFHCFSCTVCLYIAQILLEFLLLRC